MTAFSNGKTGVCIPYLLPGPHAGSSKHPYPLRIGSGADLVDRSAILWGPTIKQAAAIVNADNQAIWRELQQRGWRRYEPKIKKTQANGEQEPWSGLGLMGSPLPRSARAAAYAILNECAS